MDIKIEFDRDNLEARALDGEEKIGYCSFLDQGDLWEITHTVVNKTYAGKGIAGKLLDNVVDEARADGVKLIPTCTYAQKKFDQDREKYGDIDGR